MPLLAVLHLFHSGFYQDVVRGLPSQIALLALAQPRTQRRCTTRLVASMCATRYHHIQRVVMIAWRVRAARTAGFRRYMRRKVERLYCWAFARIRALALARAAVRRVVTPVLVAWRRWCVVTMERRRTKQRVRVHVL